MQQNARSASSPPSRGPQLSMDKMQRKSHPTPEISTRIPLKTSAARCHPTPTSTAPPAQATTLHRNRHRPRPPSFCRFLPGSSPSIPSLFWPFFASHEHEGPRTRRERDRSRPGFLAQLHHAPFSRENGLLTAASPAQSVGHIPKTKAGGGKPKYEKERTQYQPCRKRFRDRDLCSFVLFLTLMSDSESGFVT